MSDDRPFGDEYGDETRDDTRDDSVDEPVEQQANGEVEGSDADAPAEPLRTISINDFEGTTRAEVAGGAQAGPPAVTPSHLASIDDHPDAVPAYLALDLGTARLSAGIVSLDGDVVVRDRVATPQRSVWPALTQLASRVIAANQTELRPRWCGVTSPGPIDHDKGLLMPIGLPIWNSFPLVAELEALLGIPVAVDSHGRGLAYAEQWLGAAASVPLEQQHLATIVFGDDVDGGLIERGVVMQGRRKNLGGFGHICVEPDGVECPCGGRGCLAMYTSVRAIEADTGRDLGRTPSAIVKRSATMAARAIGSLAAMLDVSEVVIAGVVPSVFGQPFYDALDEELDDRSRLRHLDRLVVRPASATLGPLVSAAAIARGRVQMVDELSTADVG